MTNYERRDAIHDRQGKFLTGLVGFLIVAPLVIFIGVAIPFALVGIDLWGYSEPSPAPGWWDWFTDVLSLGRF